MVVPYIQPAPYYVGIAMYIIGAVVLGSTLIFHILAHLGIVVSIRKEQDRIMMYLLTFMNMCGFIHACMVCASLMYTPSTNCLSLQYGGTWFYQVVKPILFVLLARKATLVQYTGNAAKWAFRLDYALIAIFLGWEITLMVWPGMEKFSHFTDKTNGLGMCLVSFAAQTPSVSTAMETVINVLNLFIFVAPLRAHQLESRNTTGTAGSNSNLIGAVIRRNMKGTAATILMTWTAKISASVIAANINGNIGLATINYGLVCLDETVAVLAVMYVCHNAYQIPCMPRVDAKGTTTNVSGGKSSVDGNEATV